MSYLTLQLVSLIAVAVGYNWNEYAYQMQSTLTPHGISGNIAPQPLSESYDYESFVSDSLDSGPVMYRSPRHRYSDDSGDNFSGNDQSYYKRPYSRIDDMQTSRDTGVANSVLEMILNVKNPLSGQPLVPDFYVQNYNGRMQLHCASVACQGCMQVLFDKLEQSISGEAGDDDLLAEMRQMQHSLRLRGNDYRQHCRNLNNDAADYMDCNVSTVTPEDMDTLHNYLYGERIVCPVRPPDWRQPKHRNLFVHNRNLEISFRNRGAHGEKVVHGTSTQLTCTYRRGEQLEHDHGNVALCDMCWSFLMLPNGYSPRIISQLTCNAADSKCLSGYGQCNARYRHINVWQSGKNADKESAVVNVPVACECLLPYSSTLRNLVVG